MFFGIHQPLFYLYWSTKTGHISYRQISAVSIAKLTLELDDRLLLDIHTNFMSSVTKLGKLDDQLGEIRASIVMKSAVPGGAQHREATKFENQWRRKLWRAMRSPQYRFWGSMLQKLIHLAANQ